MIELETMSPAENSLRKDTKNAKKNLANFASLREVFIHGGASPPMGTLQDINQDISLQNDALPGC
jgi:hypothetical protein